jgi:putative membrane protein
MLKLVTRLVLSAAALLAIAAVVPGIHATGFGSAFVAAILLALVNVSIRPILIVLTLPITIVTLGFFLLIINAGMLLLVGHIVTGFTVRGWGAGIVGSLLLWFAGMAINRVLNEDNVTVDGSVRVIRHHDDD